MLIYVRLFIYVFSDTILSGEFFFKFPCHHVAIVQPNCDVPFLFSIFWWATLLLVFSTSDRWVSTVTSSLAPSASIFCDFSERGVEG